jgi:hypothetical protein
MDNETVEEHITRLELMGIVDRNCITCQKNFIMPLKEGVLMASIYMPAHKPSPRCESGKHPHCTCDICF